MAGLKGTRFQKELKGLIKIGFKCLPSFQISSTVCRYYAQVNTSPALFRHGRCLTEMMPKMMEARARLFIYSHHHHHHHHVYMVYWYTKHTRAHSLFTHSHVFAQLNKSWLN